MVVALIVIGVLLLIGLIFILIRNSIIGSRNRVDEAWSGIDVQLKRRHDLVPNLVEAVKGYATHERETFEKVTQARAAAMQASGPAQASQAEGVLSQALGGLRVVAEQYPELRATENFQQLIAQPERARGRDPGLAPDLQLQRPGLQHEDPDLPELGRRLERRLHGAGVLRDRGPGRPRGADGLVRRPGARHAAGRERAPVVAAPGGAAGRVSTRPVGDRRARGPTCRVRVNEIVEVQERAVAG